MGRTTQRWVAGFAALAATTLVAAGCGEGVAPRKDAGAGGEGDPADQAGASVTSERAGRIGDVAVVEVGLPGFAEAAPEARAQAWCLSRAAVVADAVLHLQRGPEHPRIQQLLAAIVAHPSGTPPAIMRKIEPYAQRFWLHHGNHDERGEKFVPRFIPGELGAAAQNALRAGADIGTGGIAGLDLGANRLDELEALVRLVRPHVFDRRFEPTVVAAGADGGVEVGALRAGRAGIAPGRGADDLRRMVEGLRGCQPRLTPDGAKRVGGLIDRLETGDPADGGAYLRATTDSATGAEILVDFVPDPRVPADDPGAIGALVVLPDRAANELIAALEKAAPRIDKRLFAAIDPGSNGGGMRSERVRQVQVVFAAGAYGPLLPGEVDLASPGPALRRRDARETLVLGNLATARAKELDEPLIRALAPDPVVAERRLACRERSRLARWALREVLGRGTDGTERRPKGWLGNRLGDLEPVTTEMRADLVALYAAFDPQLAQIGLVPSEECARAIYDDFVAAALERGWADEAAAAPSDPLVQGTQVVVRALIDKGVVQVSETEGRVALRVTDHGAMREAVRGLLREIRRIRLAGDREAAAALVQKHGGALPAAWRRGLDALRRAGGPPRGVAYAYPRIEQRASGGGAPGDVVALEPAGFVERMRGPTTDALPAGASDAR